MNILRLRDTGGCWGEMLLNVLVPRLQMSGYRVDCVQLTWRNLSARLMAHTITNLPSRHRKELEVWLYSSFNLGPRCGGCSTPRLGCFTPVKRPGTHCTRGWMGPRVGLGRLSTYLTNLYRHNLGSSGGCGLAWRSAEHIQLVTMSNMCLTVAEVCTPVNPLFTERPIN